MPQLSDALARLIHKRPLPSPSDTRRLLEGDLF